MIQTQLYLLFVFLLFIISPSLAQNGFHPGYYIDKAGERIEVDIAYPIGNKKYREFRVKSSSSQRSLLFSPNEVQMYGLEENRVFYSKKIEWEGVEKHVFLEALIIGEVNLFQYRQSFFVEFADQLKRIYISETINEEDWKYYTESTSHHLAILAKAFESCVSLRSEIISERRIILPRQKILVKVVQDYHDCVGKPYKSYKQLPWSKLKLGVFGGGEISQVLLFSKNVNSDVNETNFNISTSLYAGISFEYSMPRLSEKLSFILNPSFQKNYIQGFDEEYSTVGQITRRDFIFRFDEILVPIGVKYLLFPSIKQISIAGGLSPQFYLNQDFLIRQEVEFISSQSVQYSEPQFKNINPYQIGIWLRGEMLLLSSENFDVPVQISYQNTAGLVSSPFLFSLDYFATRSVQHSIFLSFGLQF